MASHNPVKFGSHSHSGSVDIIFLVADALDALA